MVIASERTAIEGIARNFARLANAERAHPAQLYDDLRACRYHLRRFRTPDPAEQQIATTLRELIDPNIDRASNAAFVDFGEIAQAQAGAESLTMLWKQRIGEISVDS